MPGEYSHDHGVTIHQGPMADTRGTGWRADAAKLEEANQRQIESPEKTPPNELSSLGKAHAARAKSDEGTVDKTGHAVGGDHTKVTGQA